MTTSEYVSALESFAHQMLSQDDLRSSEIYPYDAAVALGLAEHIGENNRGENLYRRCPQLQLLSFRGKLKTMNEKRIKELEEILESYDYLVEHCEGKSYSKAALPVESMRAELKRLKNVSV